MSDDVTLDDLGIPTVTQVQLDVAHAQRIAATLDSDAPIRAGESVPSLWHWAYFTPTAPTASLGHDGHPRLSSSRLADFPRRMWGAGTVTWHGDLRFGEPATRTTTIESVKSTAGASGALMIVGLQHRYDQGGHDVIVEQQSIVYRGAGDPVPLPLDSGAPTPEVGVVQQQRRPDPALLFRFSAITFNAHRIHYDAPYAAQVEGYPGLVVHGPLTSLQLAHHVETTTGRRLGRWQFKATAPMFAGCSQWFQCDPTAHDGTGQARVLRNDGAVAMDATYHVVDQRG
jgi:3-methylfumaryl-CoA hydratase